MSATLGSKYSSNFGLVIRVQELQRYHALMLRNDQRLAIVKLLHGHQTVPASVPMNCANDDPERSSTFEARGSHLRGVVDGVVVEAGDISNELDAGAIALLVDAGHLTSSAIDVEPW